jgi:hypothetical protein
MSVEELERAALKLPPVERERLAAKLLSSRAGPPEVSAPPFHPEARQDFDETIFFLGGHSPAATFGLLTILGVAHHRRRPMYWL